VIVDETEDPQPVAGEQTVSPAEMGKIVTEG
jgi:hypothetical protein